MDPVPKHWYRQLKVPIWYGIGSSTGTVPINPYRYLRNANEKRARQRYRTVPSVPDSKYRYRTYHMNTGSLLINTGMCKYEGGGGQRYRT